ncbi:hypothetical protein [Agrococcus sp. TF02-05]|uniref:hypothetical protein n=1 Tax=Agrococcus sp. TF02-05 TaxID=2815211 RepID=UPI001AA0FC21|nr:hypothetical protein [Agrococcus sp. TF02-05]MBO1770453.1 hypothetical protein [Agrococcus sp. TF02-05]
MSVLRKEWSLHTPAGRAPLMLGSSWGFDRSWSPQGAGEAILALDDPATAAIAENSREPLRIVCDLWHTSPPGTLGTGAMAGTKLGDAAWPLETLVEYPGNMLDPDGNRITHKRAAWHCWPGRVRRDRRARTLTVELLTIEGLLTEIENLGEPWLPAPTVAPARHRLSDVLLELSRYVRLPLGVTAHSALIPAAAMRPWEPGETAWEWWNQLRVAAEMSYRYDATTNTMLLRGWAEGAVGEVSTDWLDWVEELGGAGEQDFNRYADAVRIVWTWTDRVSGEERTHAEVALAPGITDWRDATRPRTFEYSGQPQTGLARLYVNRLARWKNLATVMTPLDESTLVDLLTDRGATAQAIHFAIDEEPTVTFTIITEE